MFPSHDPLDNPHADVVFIPVRRVFGYGCDMKVMLPTDQVPRDLTFADDDAITIDDKTFMDWEVTDSIPQSKRVKIRRVSDAELDWIKANWIYRETEVKA